MKDLCLGIDYNDGEGEERLRLTVKFSLMKIKRKILAKKRERLGMLKKFSKKTAIAGMKKKIRVKENPVRSVTR